MDVYRAIADPTRRLLMDELVKRDDQTLFELCTRLLTEHGVDSSRQAISQHLDTLESVGLISSRRDGRYKFHRLHTEPLSEIHERWPVRREEEHRRSI